MKFPTAPANWKTSAPDTRRDLVLVRDRWIDLLTYIREQATSLAGVIVDLSTYKTDVANTYETKTDAANTYATKDYVKRGHLWQPPGTPHANDEEFDQDGKPAGWTWYDAFSGGVYTPVLTDPPPVTTPLYPNLVAPASPQVSYNTARKSHAFVLIPYNGNIYQFLKPTTIPTNCVFWCRMGISQPAQVEAANYPYVGMFLRTDNGGPTAESVDCSYIYRATPTAGYYYRFGGYDGSTGYGGSGAPATRPFELQSNPVYPYLIINKAGDYWHGMIMDDAGNMVDLSGFYMPVTYPWTYYGFFFRHAVAPPSTTINIPYQIDFIRQVDTYQFIPGMGQT